MHFPCFRCLPVCSLGAETEPISGVAHVYQTAQFFSTDERILHTQGLVAEGRSLHAYVELWTLTQSVRTARSRPSRTRRIREHSRPVPSIDVGVEARRLRQDSRKRILTYEPSNRRIIPAPIIIVQTCRLANRFARKPVT